MCSITAGRSPTAARCCRRAAQLDRATAIVEEARARLKGVLTIDYVVPDYYARRPKACMGGWGRQFLNVSPAGKVLPCHAAESLAGFHFPTVMESGLADIWYRSDAFNRFRGTDWMPEPCRSCERREIDWGGCRCQAFALTGDAARTDPACALAPDHDALLALANAESAAPPPPLRYRRIPGPFENLFRQIVLPHPRCRSIQRRSQHHQVNQAADAGLSRGHSNVGGCFCQAWLNGVCEIDTADIAHCLLHGLRIEEVAFEHFRTKLTKVFRAFIASANECPDRNIPGQQHCRYLAPGFPLCPAGSPSYEDQLLRHLKQLLKR